MNKGEESLNSYDEEETKILNQLGLLSIKPKIIVCNVDEESLSSGNKYTQAVKNKFSNEKIVIICADIEDQIMGLDSEEREVFMKDIGLNKTHIVSHWVHTPNTPSHIHPPPYSIGFFVSIP